MGAEDSFSIDELARAAGMTARNVRAYRTKGLLQPPVRTGRASQYRTAHLRRLRNIRELRDAGLPLKLIVEAARRGEDLGPGGPLRLLAARTVEGPDLGRPDDGPPVVSDPGVYESIRRLREVGLPAGLALVVALRIAQRGADLARDVDQLLTLEAPHLDGQVRVDLTKLTVQIIGDVVHQVLLPGG